MQNKKNAHRISDTTQSSLIEKQHLAQVTGILKDRYFLLACFLLSSTFCYSAGGQLLPSRFGLDKETQELFKTELEKLQKNGLSVHVPVNVCSEDIRKALDTVKLHVRHEISVPTTTITAGTTAAITLGSFGTSLYQFNVREQSINSTNVLIPAALAASGICYLLWSNRSVPEPQQEAAKSTSPEIQKRESNGILASQANSSSNIVLDEKVARESTKLPNLGVDDAHKQENNPL